MKKALHPKDYCEYVDGVIFNEICTHSKNTGNRQQVVCSASNCSIGLYKKYNVEEGLRDGESR